MQYVIFREKHSPFNDVTVAEVATMGTRRGSAFIYLKSSVLAFCGVKTSISHPAEPITDELGDELIYTSGDCLWYPNRSNIDCWLFGGHILINDDGNYVYEVEVLELSPNFLPFT